MSTVTINVWVSTIVHCLVRKKKREEMAIMSIQTRRESGGDCEQATNWNC